VWVFDDTKLSAHDKETGKIKKGKLKQVSGKLKQMAVPGVDRLIRDSFMSYSKRIADAENHHRRTHLLRKHGHVPSPPKKIEQRHLRVECAQQVGATVGNKNWDKLGTSVRALSVLGIPLTISSRAPFQPKESKLSALVDGSIVKPPGSQKVIKKSLSLRRTYGSCVMTSHKRRPTLMNGALPMFSPGDSKKFPQTKAHMRIDLRQVEHVKGRRRSLMDSRMAMHAALHSLPMDSSPRSPRLNIESKPQGAASPLSLSRKGTS
jgi:hypothetical protein